MANDRSNCIHMWVHDKRMKSDSSRFYEGGHMSFSELNAYSYSTVIAQCLDRKNHVFLVIDENLTNTTGRHVSEVSGAIPNDWVKVATHWSGGRGYYDSVNFLGWNEKFSAKKRMELVTHLIMDVYRKVQAVPESKSKGTGELSLKPLMYISSLNRVYGDCSLEKWLRKSFKYLDCGYEFSDNIGEQKKVWENCRKMVSMILECRFVCKVETVYFGKNNEYSYQNITYRCEDEDWKRKVVDATLGDGTWDAYLKRTEGIDKAKKTADKMSAIREYLKLEEAKSFCRLPAGAISNHDLRRMLKSNGGIRELIRMKADRIKRLTKEYEENARLKRVLRAMNNARKFLGMNEISKSELSVYAFSPHIDSVVCPDGRTLYSDSNQEKPIREKYSIPNYVYKSYVFIDNDDSVYFGPGEYTRFCEAPDKKQWRKRFWQLCELKMRRKRGEYLYGLYFNKYGFTFELDEGDSHIMNEFVVRKEKYERDQERMRKHEEEMRRLEYEKKLNAIEAYRNEGIEGVRKIWREHLGPIPSEINLAGSELFYGGNVLLRFSSTGRYIETSKGIHISFSDAHRYWNTIKEWHDTGKFRKVEMAGYTVQSFDNGILVAGCHEIAYEEMERMYRELCEREAA